jgi:hypothetical protein
MKARRRDVHQYVAVRAEYQVQPAYLDLQAKLPYDLRSVTCLVKVFYLGAGHVHAGERDGKNDPECRPQRWICWG